MGTSHVSRVVTVCWSQAAPASNRQGGAALTNVPHVPVSPVCRSGAFYCVIRVTAVPSAGGQDPFSSPQCAKAHSERPARADKAPVDIWLEYKNNNKCFFWSSFQCHGDRKLLSVTVCFKRCRLASIHPVAAQPRTLIQLFQSQCTQRTMSVTLGLILVKAPKPKYYCQNTGVHEHTIKIIWVDTKALLGMFRAGHNKWETSCLTKEKISLCNVQSQPRSIQNDQRARHVTLLTIHINLTTAALFLSKQLVKEKAHQLSVVPRAIAAVVVHFLGVDDPLKTANIRVIKFCPGRDL